MDTHRLLAIVEYDGTDFEGFQIQARRRTVQGELEKTLHKITGDKIRVIGAGRTDTGCPWHMRFPRPSVFLPKISNPARINWGGILEESRVVRV